MNFGEFIKRLESIGELKRIRAEVDSNLEITEIAFRVSKAGGPALLFENVMDSSFPLIINTFGSLKRMQFALNCNSYDEIADRIESLIKIQPPKGFREKVKILFTLKDISEIIPKRDLLISEGPLNALDHSSPFPNFSGKLGIDATRKTREE